MLSRGPAGSSSESAGSSLVPKLVLAGFAGLIVVFVVGPLVLSGLFRLVFGFGIVSFVVFPLVMITLIMVIILVAVTQLATPDVEQSPAHVGGHNGGQWSTDDVSQRKEDAFEALKLQYARGEIDDREFERRVESLHDGTDPVSQPGQVDHVVLDFVEEYVTSVSPFGEGFFGHRNARQDSRETEYIQHGSRKTEYTAHSSEESARGFAESDRSTNSGRPTESTTSEGKALEQLQLRYVNGELSEAEFQRKRDVLLELET